MLGALCALLLLSPGGAAHAQDDRPGRSHLREEAVALVDSLGTLEAWLLREDRELREMDLALGEQLMRGIVAADPTVVRDAARLPELEREAAAARATGDLRRLRAVLREHAAIEARYVAAREAALGDSAMAAGITRFQRMLQQRLAARFPAAAALLRRLRTLENALAETPP